MPTLETRHVSVRFGGVEALSDVDLQVLPGRVTGLIGPNGAGKTTLLNTLVGLQTPTRGRVLLDGDDVTGLSVHRRARRGIARTFQRLEVFGSLTVRDNVLVAAEIHRRRTRAADEPRAATERVLDRVGLRPFADQRANAVPTGIARLTEMGRALATRPSILLLDEPSSGLSESEARALGDLLVDLAREGRAILLVAHDVDLVLRVCTWVAVLNVGRMIAAGSPDAVRDDPAVQAAYLGSGGGT